MRIRRAKRLARSRRTTLCILIILFRTTFQARTDSHVRVRVCTLMVLARKLRKILRNFLPRTYFWMVHAPENMALLRHDSSFSRIPDEKYTCKYKYPSKNGVSGHEY